MGKLELQQMVLGPVYTNCYFLKNKETGEFEEATWDEALDLVASKFTEIKNTYGGEALAGFACSRSTNEDIYMLQKMVRTVFKSNNTDNCARV